MPILNHKKPEYDQMINPMRIVVLFIFILNACPIMDPQFFIYASADNSPLIFDELSVTDSVALLDKLINVDRRIYIHSSGKLYVENSTLSLGIEYMNSCNITIESGGEFILRNSSLMILSPYSIDINGKFVTENSSIIVFGKESLSYNSPHNRNATNEMRFRSAELTADTSRIERMNLSFSDSRLDISTTSFKNTAIITDENSQANLFNNTFIAPEWGCEILFQNSNLTITRNKFNQRFVIKSCEYLLIENNSYDNATCAIDDSRGSIRDNDLIKTPFGVYNSIVNIFQNRFISFGGEGNTFKNSTITLTDNIFDEDLFIERSIQMYYCSITNITIKDNLFIYNSSNVIDSERNLVGRNYEYLSVRLIKPANSSIQLERVPFVTWSNHGLGWRELNINYLMQSYDEYIPTYEIMENGSIDIIKNITVHVNYSGKEIQKPVIFRSERITRLEIQIPGDEKKESGDGIPKIIAISVIVTIIFLTMIVVMFYFLQKKKIKRLISK